jgi:hypothetical protein
MRLSRIIFVKVFILCLMLSISSCSPNYLKGFELINNSDLKIPGIFNNDYKKSLYKANLKIMGRGLSGILLIKRINTSEFRIVFMSEIGLKYFDLGINFDGVEPLPKTYYIMSVLDRGDIVDILIKDFTLLLSDFNSNRTPALYRSGVSGGIAVEYQDGQAYFCFRKSGSDKIEAVKWKSKTAGHSGINLNKYSKGIPSAIEIKNARYSLWLTLHLIES